MSDDNLKPWSLTVSVASIRAGRTLYEYERSLFQSTFPEFSEYAIDLPDDVLQGSTSPYEILQKLLRLSSRYRLDRFLSIESESFKLAAVRYRIKRFRATDDYWPALKGSILVGMIKDTLEFLRAMPEHIIADFGECFPDFQKLYEPDGNIPIGQRLYSIWYLDFRIDGIVAICEKSRIRTTRKYIDKMRTLMTSENGNVLVYVNMVIGKMTGFYNKVSVKRILSARRRIWDMKQMAALDALPDFNFQPLFPNNEYKAELVTIKEILTKERLIELHYEYNYCLPDLFRSRFISLEISKPTELEFKNNLPYYEVHQDGKFIGILDASRPRNRAVVTEFWTTDNKSSKAAVFKLGIAFIAEEMFHSASQEAKDQRLLECSKVAAVIGDQETMARHSKYQLEKIAKILKVEEILVCLPQYTNIWVLPEPEPGQ